MSNWPILEPDSTNFDRQFEIGRNRFRTCQFVDPETNFCRENGDADSKIFNPYRSMTEMMTINRIKRETMSMIDHSSIDSDGQLIIAIISGWEPSINIASTSVIAWHQLSCRYPTRRMLTIQLDVRPGSPSGVSGGKKKNLRRIPGGWPRRSGADLYFRVFWLDGRWIVGCLAVAG